MRVTVLGSRGNIRPSAPGHAYKDIAGSIRKIEALGNGVRVVAAYDGLTMDV